MRLLLVGESTPSSPVEPLRQGLAAAGIEVTFVDSTRAGGVEPATTLGRVRLRRRGRTAGERLVEAATQLAPDAVLIVHGRGIGPEAIESVRSMSCPVTIYYPDNPFWRSADWDPAMPRLAAADAVAVTTERIAGLLDGRVRSKPAVVPLGYDDQRFPLTTPGADRHGLAFVGSWSPRRERFLAALDGLPLTVEGSGWERSRVRPSPPAPSRRAAVGVNLLHPRAGGSHNAQTRQIPASGAMLLTDPGTDGTPLVDGESCVWFHSPDELRAKAEWALQHADEAVAIAFRGQAFVAADTWTQRARVLAGLIGALETQGAPS